MSKTRKDKKPRLGEKHITREGYEVEIVKYLGAYSCDIVFECGFLVEDIQYARLVKGNIKYPFHPSIYGVGYFGVGRYKAGSIYDAWSKMLMRCYSESTRKRYITYKDCTVDERWHNFQVFAQWYEDNRKPHMKEGWSLDKDILQKGNKIYSPETCCLVPCSINSLFVKTDASRGKYPIGMSLTKEGSFKVGLNMETKSVHIGTFKIIEKAFQAYKMAKESYIKRVADKWKDQIDPRVYQAMYNYQIEITD